MVATCDFPAEIALELPQRHGGVLLRIVRSSFNGIPKRCAGQKMHLAHHRADEPLDMASIVRFAGRTPNDVDPFIPATANEGFAPEIRAVIDVNGFRQPGHWPGRIDFTLP